MAYKNSPVYLGFLDEQVTSKNKYHLNFNISKVGGTPNWCGTECENPSCTVCKRKMPLVLQLYAALENSPYHRTLYIFACITPACWNRPHSWVCLRSQVLDSKQVPSHEATSNEMWMEDEDCWDDPSDDGNGNVCTPSKVMLEYMALKAKALAEKGTNANHEDNLNQKVMLHSSTITDVATCMEKQMNLNEGDSNANESLCGAVGVQGSGEETMMATAVIEGAEGDMIAVETPEEPHTDIPALFKEVTVVDSKVDVTFVSYFVAVSLEPQEDTSFSDHEQELYLRYTNATGHELKEEDFIGGSDGQGSDNLYEKMSAHHGDSLLHKFKKRVLRSPQQIVRYCREDSGFPLWMRPPNLSRIAQACDRCGARLIFETQVMPQLVSCLRAKDVAATVLEFGTVVVYTCAASCWTEGERFRREFCFVQAEEV